MEEETTEIPQLTNTAQENFVYNDIINSEIKFKNRILKKMDVDISDVINFNLRLFPNKLDSKILKILRVLLINHKGNFDKDAIFNHDFSNIYSSENENFIHKYLFNNLNFHYKSLRDKNYERKIEELGKINTKDKYDQMNLFIIEND